MAVLSAASADAQNVRTRHVREVVASGATQAIGSAVSDRVLNLDMVLPLRDPDGLEIFLQDLYDPSSSSYRKFLTPAT